MATVPFSLLFVACQSSDRGGEIDLKSTDYVSIDSIFSKVEIVRLENSGENLISEINKVIFKQGFYYILDGKSQQIFCFSEKGDYVFKIAAKGNGPGEYHYITDIAVSEINKHIFALDPVMQRVLFFDLKGAYLKTVHLNTDQTMGYDKVIQLNDSILLATSVTHFQLIFYNLHSDSIIKADFAYPTQTTLLPFIAPENFYQFKGKTYFLPALSQHVYDITEVDAIQDFVWDFGNYNNNEAQVETLISAVESQPPSTQTEPGYRFTFEEVGKGRILNQLILKVGESERFKMAILEFGDSYKHVFIDKRSNQTLVFDHFIEEISLVYGDYLTDRAVTYRHAIHDYILKADISMLKNRILNYYNINHLSESDRFYIENHNPMTDNPFLVVYKFKE